MLMKNKKIDIYFRFCNISKCFMIISFVLVLVECLATIGVTYFESEAIDLFAYKNSENKDVLVIIYGMIIFIVFQWIWSVFIPYRFKKNSINQISAIREKIYESIINASTTDIKKIGSGDITMRVSVEINRIQTFLSTDLYIVLKRFIMAIGALLLSLYFDWKLAILECVMLPFIVKKNRDADESMDENYYMIDEYYGQMGNLFTSILNSIKLIKTFCVDNLFEKRLSDLLDNIQQESVVNNKKIVHSANRLTGINLLPTMIHFSVGTLFVLFDWISLGEFVAFAVLRGYVTNFLMYIPTFIPKCRSVYASIQRIMDITNLKATYHIIQSAPFSEEFIIQGNNICFSYDEQLVLKNLNISIYSNSINLLVGESGSGKTTLLNVLCNVLIPDGGNIVYNSKLVTETEIQKDLAYVSQASFISRGTIKENVNFYGKSTDEEVVDICKKLNIHETIMELPRQYETMIGGQEGNILSGGQIQRLCLARAFLSRAKIIFMDEPSSALDVKNEMEILQLLKEIKRDKTLVISTHSTEFIDEADYVFLVEGGTAAKINDVDKYLMKSAEINYK